MMEDGETVIATFFEKTTKRKKKLQTSVKKEEEPSLDCYIITTAKVTV